MKRLRHGRSLSGLPMGKVIEQRAEDQRDVPAPNEALDQPEQEGLPGKQLKAREKDRERSMQAGKDQVADDADNVGDCKEQAQAHSEGENRNAPIRCQRYGPVASEGSHDRLLLLAA